MKVGVCVIIKNENLYIRDWVEYYKKIGFDTVILFDNNDLEGEYPLQVIGDYIRSGYVHYYSLRGALAPLQVSYMWTYREYRDKLDWIAYFDCDEFLELVNESDIHDYLSRDMFKTADVIDINWKCYGDNEKISYEQKPVWERFPLPAMPLDFKSYIFPEVTTNNHVKCIVRCNPNYIIRFNEPHNAIVIDEETQNEIMTRYVNASGKEIPYDNFTDYDYENAFLKHYITLSLEEFLYRRFGRKTYANIINIPPKKVIMGIYYSCNKMTQEKKEIIEEFFRGPGKSYGK